jgi:hypothetical protein
MAKYVYSTVTMDRDDIDEMIEELEECDGIHDHLETQATVTGIFFGVVGLGLCFVPGGQATGIASITAGIASLANGGYAWACDNVEEVMEKAIKKLEDVKDELQDNPAYTAAKIEFKFRQITLSGKTYNVPYGLSVDGYILDDMHSGGWA